MSRQADLFATAPTERATTEADPATAPIVALTYWQPWASMHAAGTKIVENRGWRPPPSRLRVGGLYAIHAGAVYDPAAHYVHGLPTRALLAVVRLQAVVTDPEDLPEDQRRWFAGPFGWVAPVVRRFASPIPFQRGAQGLWTLPEDARRLIAVAMTEPR